MTKEVARALPRLAALALCLLMLLFSRTAGAYPWMIRHGYTGCIPCHADPSGSGPLTAYGRAQGDILLTSQFGEVEDEPGKSAELLWGLVPLPDNIHMGGDLRGGRLDVKVSGAPPVTELILMRADLYGDLQFGRVRAAGSIGYAPTGALGAAVTRSSSDNVVSRDHWLGYQLDEDGSWLVRAGRINLPFGIRNIEHTLWVRALTRTDINDEQQDGVALSVSNEQFRAEVMGILGNYQRRPDEFRERGYSGYAEWAPSTRLALGVSSLFTRARRDIHFKVTDYRQADGVFVRYSPSEPLVILGEADWVYQSLTWNGHRGGYAAMVQADVEPAQGFHWMLTGEAKNDGAGVPSSYGAWLSVAWFFAPHVDARLDEIFQSVGIPGGSVDAITALVQLHAYL